MRPTKLDLQGVKSHVVQGSNVQLTCDVYGAKPAATVKWNNNSNPITDEGLIETRIEDAVSEALKLTQFTFQSTILRPLHNLRRLQSMGKYFEQKHKYQIS